MTLVTGKQSNDKKISHQIVKAFLQCHCDSHAFESLLGRMISRHWLKTLWSENEKLSKRPSSVEMKNMPFWYNCDDLAHSLQRA